MPKAMRIAAIRETFADEWVAARVTKVDKADVPVAGEILTHSPNKQTVYQTAKSYLGQHPAARLFIFFTGDPIPEGWRSRLPSASRIRGRPAHGGVLLVPVRVQGQRVLPRLGGEVVYWGEWCRLLGHGSWAR